MPVGYWLFVGLTLVLVSLVGYGVYATNRLLRTWQPDRNVLLLPGENVVRLVLVLFCLLLGAASGLSRAQLGWSLQAWGAQTWIGLGWGWPCDFLLSDDPVDDSKWRTTFLLSGCNQGDCAAKPA